MKRLSPIMLAGTGSDVGKSMLATGLCRIFRQDGYNPAPFKAQNMALNSYATPDGLEIGRAQAVQAEAACIPCSADMNPLLLKPTGERTSQVVLNGRVIGNRDAYDYFRREGRERLRDEVHSAFDRLSERYNPIVMEGAGSISELNLRDSDLVNMPMARYADAKVILVADIDRGGVFASIYGSVMLQDDEDRNRICGVIVNKFRGDMRLFESGCRMIEEICGKPVLGVVPYMDDVHVEEEDSVAICGKNHKVADAHNGQGALVNVAVVLHRHISNFTDFNRLEHDNRVNLYYTNSPDEVRMADIVILPGSKSTLADLYDLRVSGMAKAVNDVYVSGKTVLGICGGYQMMGEYVSDPDGVEGDITMLPGLGLLPMRTVIGGEKVTRQVKFRFLDGDTDCSGYEIHMGMTVPAADSESHSSGGSCLGKGRVLNRLADGSVDGYFVSQRCMGSYIHGILDNQEVIDFLLHPYVDSVVSVESSTTSQDYAAYKESQYDLLAERLREYVDIPKLYRIMEGDND
ncbi:MAG: cobyric acid synthase [Duncaniella sp.]|nr:cobyric acid synthase [Duncaniella sp.]